MLKNIFEEMNLKKSIKTLNSIQFNNGEIMHKDEKAKYLYGYCSISPSVHM